MTFTLIIYIYIGLPNFVNVTMYCYRHVTYLLLLHVFMHVYNVPKPNSCPSLHVLQDTRQPLMLAKTTEASMHTCSSSSSSSRTDRWVHFQQNAGLRLFVHT